MKDLGVEVLHLRNVHDEFVKGEQVFFEGFEIDEDTIVDSNEDGITFDETVSIIT